MEILRNKNIILIIVFFFNTGIYSQEVPQRIVKSSTITTSYFSVPDSILIDSIPDFDLVNFTSNNIQENIEYIIINNFLTMIYTYPQLPRYENDYQFEVGKYILNVNGSTLYDHNDNILNSVSTTELDTSFILSNDQINDYGNYYHFFSMNPDQVVSSFNQAGFITNNINNDIITAVKDNIEIEIDFNTLTNEIRYFNNELLILSHKSFYCQNGEIIYPLNEIKISFDTLPISGIRYQKKDEITYYNYMIIDDGDTLINISNNIP